MQAATSIGFVIVRATMFDPLLEADPSLNDDWNKFLLAWRADSEFPQYFALADLARHLVRKLEAGETERFLQIFRVVERRHVEGDSYVREAATVGLLEGLQSMNLHTRTKPDDFLPWLGPATLNRWKKVQAFWRDGIVMRDD